MSEPIRILHVLSAMDMAGVETLLMSLYRKIDRSKVQFDFAVSAIDECAFDAEIVSLGGKIYHYPKYTVTNHFQYKKWWKAFFKEHDEHRIVHGHIGSTASIYLKIAKKYGRYAIAHSHSTNANISIKECAYRLYAFPTRYIADWFFGCSQQALVDRYGAKVAFDNNKSRVLNNAIDAKTFEFNIEARNIVRKEYGANENDLIIGTVGRLTQQKNPFGILRICRELKKRGLEFQFWWFGAGELENEILKAIDEYMLNDTIHLLGTRGDVYNILQGLDLFLFPSLWEGLGIACVEAQAAGLPTFCSNTIPSEAKVCDNCFFLPLNNTGLWCDRIEQSIKEMSSAEYKRKGTFREIVNAGYDITNVAKELEVFYLAKVE